MTKFNLEKCKSGNKGITLIALIITIIVLLILAGITIASLTGSDSAPAKANEAKQRNDIGSAKDQLAVVVQNAHLEAYDDIYVAGNETVKSTAANTTVGQRVINAALEKYGASKNMKFGDASIVVAQSAEGQDATVTITTRDFTETGKISIDGGTLSWNGAGGNGGGGQATLPENAVQTLAQNNGINRWEKVSYSPGSGTIASVELPEGTSIEGTKVASLASDYPGASLSGKVSASGITDWVVLDVNETTGEVLIAPDTSSSNNTYAELTLNGMNGYNNAEDAINAVAAIYKNSTYANSARSLTVEDVAKSEDTTMAAVATVFEGNSNFEENGYDNVSASSITTSWNHRYGMDSSLNIVDYREGHENEERTYSCTPEQYAWYANYGALGTDAATYLASGNFWLASRCVFLYSNYCNFDVRYLDSGYVYYDYLFYVGSDGDTDTRSDTRSVLPVVSLKSNVQMTKDSNGVWQLSVE